MIMRRMLRCQTFSDLILNAPLCVSQPIAPNARLPQTHHLLYLNILFAVLCDKVLCVLVESLAVVLVLVGNSTFDGIIGLGSGEDLADEDEDVADLVRRLPLVGAEHA